MGACSIAHMSSFISAWRIMYGYGWLHLRVWYCTLSSMVPMKLLHTYLERYNTFSVFDFQFLVPLEDFHWAFIVGTSRERWCAKKYYDLLLWSSTTILDLRGRRDTCTHTQHFSPNLGISSSLWTSKLGFLVVYCVISLKIFTTLLGATIIGAPQMYICGMLKSTIFLVINNNS